MVWGGPRPVSGISKMVPYAGTGSDVCTKAFTTFISVSENAQKYLGESIHPIGSTRLMQIITQFFLGCLWDKVGEGSHLGRPEGDMDKILGFARQGRKNPFQCLDRAVKDFEFLV